MRVGGLVVTASHLFFAAPTAEQIGLPAGNPFQFELGMANLAFAVLGVACPWIKEKFWDAAGPILVTLHRADDRRQQR